MVHVGPRCIAFAFVRTRGANEREQHAPGPCPSVSRERVLRAPHLPGECGGAGSEAEPDVATFLKPFPFDGLLLCSDPCFGDLEHQDVFAI